MLIERIAILDIKEGEAEDVVQETKNKAVSPEALAGDQKHNAHTHPQSRSQLWFMTT